MGCCFSEKISPGEGLSRCELLAPTMPTFSFRCCGRKTKSTTSTSKQEQAMEMLALGWEFSPCVGGRRQTKDWGMDAFKTEEFFEIKLEEEEEKE